jgi:hypothetical protein
MFKNEQLTVFSTSKLLNLIKDFEKNITIHSKLIGIINVGESY